MSEAKLKRQTHASILANAVGCIYCAGNAPATQIDHMPPRIIFRQNQRPKGLEFPSCANCNQGTSPLDVVAAYMTQSFPGISNPKESAEWSKLFREVDRVAPGLHLEMHIPQKQLEIRLLSMGIFDPNVAAFRANGPILSAYMQAFAAKVGFALHYEFTNKLVPNGGRVQVRWFTSEEMAYAKVPISLYDSVGTPLAMRQGKLSSKGVFEYGAGTYENEPKINLYFAKFRAGFEVAAFVVDEACDKPFEEGELATFSPGDLQSTPYDRIID